MPFYSALLIVLVHIENVPPATTFRAALLIVPVHLDNVPPATTIRAVVQRTTNVLVHIEQCPQLLPFVLHY